jgi:hypothetical protein
MATQQTDDVTDTVEQLFEDLTVYRDIGLDTDGRAHLYDPDARQIVVTETDRRGKGVRDADIEQRIDIPAGSTGAWDYIQFVRAEVAGLDWAETDVPEADA